LNNRTAEIIQQKHRDLERGLWLENNDGE
jgi:hypothetical protein